MIRVKLIPQDLRREEMIVQVANVMEDLQAAIDNTSERIFKKLNTFKDRIAEVDRRAEVAKSKIEKIKECKNKATKVYSHYKYPTASINDVIFEPICKYDFDHQPERSKEVLKAPHIPFDEEILKEKLQFFTVSKGKSRGSSVWNDTSDSPLGRIPWERITSVGSLVVFNTSDNPYIRRSHGSSIIEQKMKNKRPVVHIDDQDEGLGPPPNSILHSNQADKLDGNIYNLEVSAPPEIIDDLPTTLFDLPGVAGDISFDITDTDKPDFFSPKSYQPQLPNVTFMESPNVVLDHVVPDKPFSTPPAPPTVITDRSQEPLQQQQAQTTQSQTPRGAPPPPPPPPPPPSLPDTSVKEPTKAPSNLPNIDAGRASLLESIRMAAGKPKKDRLTIKEKKIEAKKQKKKEVVSTDLMSDLKGYLESRRQGMAPKKTIDPSSAMEKVSNLIPPPPTKPTPENFDDSENSDWEP